MKSKHSKFNYNRNVLQEYIKYCQDKLKQKYYYILSYYQLIYRKSKFYLCNRYFWNMFLTRVPEDFYILSIILFYFVSKISIENVYFNSIHSFNSTNNAIFISYEKIIFYIGSGYFFFYFFWLLGIFGFWAIISYINNNYMNRYYINMYEFKTEFFRYIISYILTMVNVVLAVVSVLLALKTDMYENLHIANMLVLIIPIVSGLKFFQLWYLLRLPKNDSVDYNLKSIYYILNDFKNYFNF